MKKLKAKLQKDSATLRKHRATHWSKLQQQRSDDVVGMIMWVNKKGWREEKHQYFGQFSGKKLIKMNKNLEG